MTATIRDPRGGVGALVRTVVVGLVAALLIAVSGPVAPSFGASGVRLRTSPTPPVEGSPTTLIATVAPKAKGRRVTFQQHVGTSWRTVARARTNSRGVATAHATFTTSGSLRLRAVAATFRGRGRATGGTTVSVIGATRLSAAFPAGPWTTGSTVTVTGTVLPSSAGRMVTLQRNTASGWRTIAGPVSSDSHGHVNLRWTASPVGTASYRLAVAGTTSRAATASPSVSRQIATSALDLAAPATVTTGSQFEITYTITASSAMSNAMLVVHAPTAGDQVHPPDDFTVGGDGTATKTLGPLAAASTTRLRLRWAAPNSPATLPVDATLTGPGGVSVTRAATVHVVAMPSDSFTFDQNLKGLVDTRTRHYTDSAVIGDCQTVAAQAVPTFEATLAAIDDYTAAGTSTDAWKALQLQSRPANVDDVAATALAYQYPDAALAAAVRGYRDDPTKPDDLNIAGAAANLAGHPEWAIALETKAGTLGPGSTTGLSAEAVRLVNIGHAYALRGDYSSAENWVRQALLVAPDNDQVHGELASILYCQRNYHEANAHYRDSLRTGSVQDDMGDANPGDSTWISASKLYDLSGGTAPNLTMPTLPTTAEDLVAGSSYEGNGQYQHGAQDQTSQSISLSQQINQLEGQLTQEKKGMQPASRHQIEDLLEHVGGASADASLTDSYNALQAARSAVWVYNGGCDGQFQDNLFCEYSGTNHDCQESVQIFNGWLTRMQAYVTAFNTYYQKSWPILTGVRANISNQTAYDEAGLMIQSSYLTELGELDQQLWYASNAFASEQSSSGDLCFVASAAAPADAQTFGGGTPAACAPGSLASRVALAASFEGEEGGPGLTVKRSCELVEIDISATVLPFLQGFVKIDINNDGSGVTIYAGSRAAIGSASFESSFYTEFDGKGQVSDLGICAGPEVDVGTGVQVTAYDDHIKMSAMSTFAQPAF